MSGAARKGRSKWDTREISSDIVEISEDDSPPKNTDGRRKDGDLLPTQDVTNDNGKQVGESSNLKPDPLMHQGSAGQEQEHADGLNKDIKDRQSKASSERWLPPRMADEEHNNNDWGKLALEKATSNQGISKYADDRRRGDGWGTTVGRGHSSRMSSGPDAWGQRTRSPSPRGVWNRSRRNRSGSRSRSRSRSRERGRGRSRSRSPYFDRGSEWRAERGRMSGGPSLLCRDFTAGRCRRGLHCRFPHEDGGRRQFDEHYPADSRERYGHQNKDFMDPREPNDFPRSRQSRGHYDDGTWERSEPRRDYRSTEQCHEFVKGRCSRGASCRYVHDDSTSHVGWRDEAREIAHGRGPDSSYGNRTENRRENKRPCRFFAEGRCKRGETCPYLHEETPQSQMGPGAPDEPPKYSDGRTAEGNYSNWGEQTNAAHLSSHILSRDDRENPGSQGTSRSDTAGYVYKNRQLEDAGRSRYQIISREDFGPQGQNKPEIAASKRPQFTAPFQTSADSLNNDKVSGTDGQSASATTGNLSMQTGLHAANLIGGQHLSQIAQSQDAVPRIAGASTHLVTSQHDATSILPFNSQLHESNFSLHPNRQDQFVASQATANNSGPGMHTQPVPPYMGQNQHGYTRTSQALPDHSIFNGHNFSAPGQAPQNSVMSVHAGQSQATIEMSNPSQDSGTQSMQNTHNFQPVVPNVQIQNQTLQGLSGVPSQDNGTQSIQNTQKFQPVAPYMQSQSHTLQGLSALPSSSSADMPGAPISQNAVKSEEDFRRAVTSLAQSLIMQPGTTGLQLPLPNLNSNLMISSSGAAADVQPNPWHWAQQQAGMVQLTHTTPSEQQVPQTFQAPMPVGISNGNPVLLPLSVVPTSHAATSVVNETTKPSENKKGEPKDTDGEAPEDGDNKKNKESKESKALKMFKLALADFVKETLKPTWKEGHLTREVHKTIVKKVVDKVTSTVENTPQTKEKIDVYMSFSKEKLSKLVQAYVGKYVKTS